MIGLMTYWSVPARGRNLTRAELCLWALSAHFTRTHLGRLVLSTDNAGARLLVDRLGLPFDEVRINLEGFDPGLPEAWAMCKVETFRRSAEAGEAFLHVDGDAVMYQSPPERILRARLLAQYDERSLKNYYKLDRIAPCFPHLPEEVRPHVEARTTTAYNAGIIGGHDCTFFAAYARAALATARDPRNAGATGLHPTDQSIFLEQYFFGAFARSAGLPVETLLGPPDESEYNSHRTAHAAGFTHYLGNSKRNPKYTPRIFARAEQECPGVLARACAIAPN